MSVTIRDATSADIDAAAALMVAAYRQYEKHVPADLWDPYEEEIADVRRRLPHSDLIVAEHDGRLVGAVTFYRDATKSEHQGWPEGYAEIRLLAVDPSARGLGVGRLLTDECIRRAKENGNPTIGLHTSRLMSVAQAMYERMGFVRVPDMDFNPDPDPDTANDIIAIAYRLDL